MDGAAGLSRGSTHDGLGIRGDLEYELRRGAWLCLVGEKDAGLKALRSAQDRYSAVIHRSSYPEADIAIHACGGSSVHDGHYDDVVHAAGLLVASNPTQSIAQLDLSRSPDRVTPAASPLSACAEALDKAGLVRALDHVAAAELQGAGSLLAAIYHFHVGDREGARARLQPALTTSSARTKVDAELFLAMMELLDSRAKEAVAAARRARAAASSAEDELKTSTIEALNARAVATMYHSIGWVEAAASLMSGETSVETTVPVPTYHEGAGLPTDWFALARRGLCSSSCTLAHVHDRHRSR